MWRSEVEMVGNGVSRLCSAGFWGFSLKDWQKIAGDQRGDTIGIVPLQFSKIESARMSPSAPVHPPLNLPTADLVCQIGIRRPTRFSVNLSG